MKIHNAIRITSTALGIYAGLLGAEHGIFELLQGSLPTNGPLIQAMGPACQANTAWHACFPAFTILPNYTASGVLATLFGLSVAAWAATCLQLRRGGLVLMLLSVGMFLTGGGFVPLLTGILAAAAASTFRFQGGQRQRSMPHGLRRTLAALFPWTLLLIAVWIPGSWLLGHFYPETMLKIGTPLFLLFDLLFPLVSVFAAFAYDMTPETVKSTCNYSMRKKMTTITSTPTKKDLKSLYKVGAIAVLVQLATILLILIASIALGLEPRPTTVQGFYTMYGESKLIGMLRDDFTSLILIAMYLGFAPALFFALREQNFTVVLISTIMMLAGAVGAFAVHSGFSMMHLSDLYAAAVTEAQRGQLLAAGEAVLASDMWNSTAGYMGGILLQGPGVIFSLLMLRNKDFNKVTAISGLLGNGLDLIQHLLHPFVPEIAGLIQPVMGIFYMAWFPFLARDLLRLSQKEAVE